MVIYLYGPDSYRRQEKLKWYLGKFREKHSALTVEYFDLADREALPRLKDFATAQSLFDNFKFGVLENAGEAEPRSLQDIFKISAGSSSLTLAISVEKKLAKDFKLPLGKPNITEEFAEPAPQASLAFIKKAAADRGVKLSTVALDALYNNYRSDSWAVTTELEKMALGASPEAYVGAQNFFALTGELQKSGPALYKVAALERLLSENDPAMVFNFLASRAGTEMKTKMADFDAAIKSGKTEYEEALFALALGD